jgi:hypothetical protein
VNKSQRAFRAGQQIRESIKFFDETGGNHQPVHKRSTIRKTRQRERKSASGMEIPANTVLRMIEPLASGASPFICPAITNAAAAVGQADKTIAIRKSAPDIPKAGEQK